MRFSCEIYIHLLSKRKKSFAPMCAERHDMMTIFFGCFHYEVFVVKKSACFMDSAGSPLRRAICEPS